MAYVTTMLCGKCHEWKTLSLPAGGYAMHCADCQTDINKTARDRYFEELDKMTLEARIRRIETWMLDFKVSYVEPSRY